MSADTLQAVHIAGILAIIGVLIYTVGDILLLAANVGPRKPPSETRVDISIYPGLKRRVKLYQVMAGMPWPRLAWGSLLGVFAAPLTLAGVWQVYQGLSRAGAGVALPPALLLTYAVVVGPFVHGSFFYLGENAQALNAVGVDSRSVLIGVLVRQQKIIAIGYAAILVCNLVGSIWYSALVASGQTHFPAWMAAVNPVTLTLVYFVLRRIVPKRVADAVEGSGFNLAYLAFYVLTTITLWQGGQ
jgi:hypothetical protein